VDGLYLVCNICQLSLMHGVVERDVSGKYPCFIYVKTFLRMVYRGGYFVGRINMELRSIYKWGYMSK